MGTIPRSKRTFTDDTRWSFVACGPKKSFGRDAARSPGIRSHGCECWHWVHGLGLSKAPQPECSAPGRPSSVEAVAGVSRRPSLPRPRERSDARTPYLWRDRGRESLQAERRAHHVCRRLFFKPAGRFCHGWRHRRRPPGHGQQRAFNIAKEGFGVRVTTDDLPCPTGADRFAGLFSRAFLALASSLFFRRG